MTGFDKDENRKRALDAGADRFLSKPVGKAHHLPDVIETLLIGTKKQAVPAGSGN